MKLKVNDYNGRLDIYLSSQVDKSRSQIQKIIKKDQVFVNGKLASSHYNLKNNDIIDINFKVIKKNNTLPTKEKIIKDYEIVADTENYFIINKPAGLIMHGGEHITETTLIDLLLKKFPKLKKVGEDPFRPAIVHRLDKEVSGLVIIPKNNEFFEYIKECFKKRKVKKIYTALVHGQIVKDNDIIKFPIERSSSGYKMAALPITAKGEKNLEGREAITEFKIIKRYINYTLLSVGIKTGRTHQIRVHLSAYGHPVVGDDLYSTKKVKEQNKKLNLGRIFLVANKLEFKDINDDKVNFQIDLPLELKNILKIIK